MAFWAYGLASASYWFWQRYLPQQSDNHGVLHRGAQLGQNNFIDRTWEFWAVGALGIFLVILAPWVTHGVLQLDRMLVRGLLGPTSVTQRVRDLESIRARVVDDSAVALRRIERARAGAAFAVWSCECPRACRTRLQSPWRCARRRYCPACI